MNVVREFDLYNFRLIAKAKFNMFLPLNDNYLSIRKSNENNDGVPV